ARRRPTPSATYGCTSPCDPIVSTVMRIGRATPAVSVPSGGRQGLATALRRLRAWLATRLGHTGQHRSSGPRRGADRARARALDVFEGDGRMIMLMEDDVRPTATGRAHWESAARVGEPT